jgi:hypothetical protein
VGSVTNLLTYSEIFTDSDWLKSSGASVTSNATESPLGEINADLVSVIGASYVYRTVSVTASNNYTFSIWLKSADNAGGTHPFRVYNGSTFVGEPVRLTSDWKRHTVSFTASTATAIIYIADGRVSATAENVYAWGAQVTQSAKPLPYVKTLASTVTQTFAETLRVEYDATTGENLGALIEGGSTNLALYSEDFSNADWGKTNTTITANAITAPDGTSSADKITDTSASGIHNLANAPTGNPSGEAYTFSCYIKSGSLSAARLNFATSSGNFVSMSLNLITGETNITTGGDYSNAYGSAKHISNGWWLAQITATVGADVAWGSIYGSQIRTESPYLTQSYAGSGKSLYVWGAQLEALPFATSYIRTEGAAVSRSGDNLSLPTSTLLKNLPITVNAKFDTYQGTTPATQRHLFRNDGTVPRIRAYIETSGSSITTAAGLDTVSFGITDGLFNGELTIVGTDSTLATYTDKTLFQSKANTTPWRSDLTGVTYIGGNGGGQHIFGHISKFKTYAQALTAQEITLL